MIIQLFGYPLLTILAAIANQDPSISQPAGDSKMTLRSPAIAVKRTESVVAAYIRHDGTYWTVGSTFARVRDEMTRRGWSGPMFARFQSPPGRGSSQTGIEVGCILSDGEASEDPFELTQRSPELVAYLILQDRAVATRRDYLNLHQWSVENGYTPAGPCTEIYESVMRPGSIGSPRTEVQLTLRDPAISDTVTAFDSKSQPVVQADSPIARETESVTARQEPVKGDAPVQVGAQVNPVDAMSSASLLEGCELSDASILWLGQIVLRLEAAARGIARMDADQGEAASATAKTVRAAYEGVPGGLKENPLDQSVVLVDVATAHSASGQRAITRDLDRLLGEISFKRVDGPEAQKTLKVIVRRVLEAVCRSKTDAVPRPASLRK